MTYLVSIDCVNLTRGYRFSESELPDDTGRDDRGEVYRRLRAEFGRCSGHIYRDMKEGPRAVGWTFLKRMEYDDWRPSRGGERYYLREVWATLYESCGPEDEAACVGKRPLGAATRYPFKPVEWKGNL